MESDNSEESFAYSDETGDDLDGIKSKETRPAPISAGGDEAVEEEFDYKTSMISRAKRKPRHWRGWKR